MGKGKVPSTPVIAMLFLVFVLNCLSLVIAKVDDKSNVCFKENEVDDIYCYIVFL